MLFRSELTGMVPLSTRILRKGADQFAGHDDRVWSIAWNPVRPLLASCSGDKTVRLYQYRKSPPLHNINGDNLSSPSESESDVKFELQASVPTGHSKTVRCVAWAPSGKTFATASFDSNIAIWEQDDVDSEESDLRMDIEGEGSNGRGEWECAALLEEGHETECKSVAYSSSGTLLASCSRDKTVWIWEGKPNFISLFIHRRPDIGHG